MGAAIGTCHCNSVAVSNAGGIDGWDANTSVPSDSSAGTPELDASSCHPGSVQTFVPKTYRHASAPAFASCNETQVAAYSESFQRCVAGSSDACEAPDAAVGAGSTCAACSVTSASSASYGPLISSGGLVEPNVAGCIELLDPGLL